MAAEGYPGAYRKGSAIRNLEQAGNMPGISIFHAGTEQQADGTIIANGGRVLNVCALGKDILEARASAYEAISQIDWRARLLPPRYWLALYR